MDPHANLTDFERRLAAWQPAAGGPGADALLYEAGRQAALASRPRSPWPAVAAGLAVVCVVLGARLSAERSERQALVAQWQARPAPVPDRRDEPAGSPGVEPLPAGSYAAARAIVRDPDAWLARTPAPAQPPPAPPPWMHVLTAGRRDGTIDP